MDLQKRSWSRTPGETQWVRMETLVIVDDCRYPNELDAAKKFEALTMFVYAGEACQ